MIRKRIIFFTLVALLVQPLSVYAAPLCSDGSVAPAGNICNCSTAASLSAGNFDPGVGSGLSGNTYSGIQFSGVGGALASCLNIGGLVSKAVSSVTGTGQKVPTNDSETGDNTKRSAEDAAKATQREQCLNGAAYAVAKTALQKLSDKTLNWVKTGFNGNPFYVRNIDSYLTSIKNEKLNTYLNTYVQNSDPIFGNALRSVLKQQTTGYTDGLINKAMNTPEGKAYQDFQGDFTKGGWSALLNTNNNPIGAYFKATDEISSIIDTAQENVKEELKQGNGFLSMKKCAEWETVPSALSSTATTPSTYGVPSGSGSCSVIFSGNYASCCTSVGGAATNQTQCAAYSGGYQSGQTTTATTPATPAKKPKCIRYETVTPGSLISSQVSEVTSSTFDQLINADQINEVLGNFFDQLMNRLFTDGLTGSGRGTRAATTEGGAGLNVVTGSNGQTLASATACQTPLGYNAATGGFNDEFDISRPQQLRAIILTQKNFLTHSQDAQFIMQELVPKLGALDYCMPGPNPTWNNNLNENAQTFVSLLQELIQGPGGPDTVDIIHTLLDPGGFTNSLGCTLFGDCPDEPERVGYRTTRISLFDKVDFGQKRVADRAYATKATPIEMSNYFSDTLKLLKARLTIVFSEAGLTSAFLATSSSPADATFITQQVKDIVKETGNLIGYSQGIAAYNEQYNTNIQTTKEALVELEDIYEQVQGIVGPAKARYIAEQAAANTPVKLSCIDNAYRLGPIGNGNAHLQNITATPDPMIQESADASIYFYSHL